MHDNKKLGKLVVGYVLFLASLSLLLALGGWQWRRGADKAVIEARMATARDGDQYITLTQRGDWGGMAYRPVRLQGEWLNTSFLLANRMYLGQPGYEVFTPFRLAGDGAVLLVNRGWIPPHGDVAPVNATTNADTAPRGRLYTPTKGFTLGPAMQPPNHDPPDWPKVIQYLDSTTLSAALGVAVQPAAVALAAHHPAAFIPIWQARTVSSTRHYAYAVQWWGLAVTLMVFGTIWRRQASTTAPP